MHNYLYSFDYIDSINDIKNNFFKIIDELYEKQNLNSLNIFFDEITKKINIIKDII